MFAKISESDFNKSEPIYRIIVHDNARSFGSLRLPNTSYDLTLSWRSELIEPVLESDTQSSTIWIGVDQRIACISLRGNVLFSSGLSTPLLQIEHFDKYIIVLCETEVLVVNRDYTFRKTYNFEEIADSIDIKDNELWVTFIDGNKRVFSI